jgi:hypothetical protein
MIMKYSCNSYFPSSTCIPMWDAMYWRTCEATNWWVCLSETLIVRYIYCKMTWFCFRLWLIFFSFLFVGLNDQSLWCSIDWLVPPQQGKWIGADLQTSVAVMTTFWFSLWCPLCFSDCAACWSDNLVCNNVGPVVNLNCVVMRYI